MTQNVKDLVVPVTMVAALLGQIFYLGRASQRLDTAVTSISRVEGASLAQEREEVVMRADIRNLENRLNDVISKHDTLVLRWEKDHYQLLARRVVQP